MMNEWIISSSLMIAAVLLGRRLLRGKISLRLQYALWAVVLIRLLLPFQIFTSSFGAGSIAQDMDISEPVRQVYASAREDDYERAYDAAYSEVVAEYLSASQSFDPVVVEREAAAQAEAAIELDLNKLLCGVWFAGMIVMTSVIVSCNVHLGLHLKRRRWELPLPDCLLSVYITEAVPTPCIFGLFHPAIYLTPEVAGDENVRNHVLAHELTHYRHWDHIWSVLRSLCLILHWYNPLVWIAAKVSRADAELACDEGALARLGEVHRADYGRTLIGLTCPDHGGSMFVTATTMTGSAGSIRERIKLLMKRPRNTVLALTAVVLIGAVIVGCSFAGAPETTEPTETTQPTEPVETEPEFGTVAYFDDLLNPDLYRSEADWYPRALTSYYDSPAGIDLFQLFYSGIPGADNTLPPDELAFLEDQPGYEPDFDLVRISAREMDRVLAEFFGIPLDETARIGLGNFIYNPQSGCYYHSHTDTNLGFCTVTSCEEQTTGDWRVRYTSDLGEAVVTLRQRDGKWQIVSNLPVETSSLLRSDGMIVFPGTEWNMSELEVLEALHIQEYGVFSGMRGFTVPETTFLGYPVRMALYFDQYTKDTEWGLFSAIVKFGNEADFNAVRTMLLEQLGSPDYQDGGDSFELWCSDVRTEELVSAEAYEQFRQERTVSITENNIYADGAAVTVSCYGAGSSNEYAICFDAWHTKALQIEAALSTDQTDEARASLSEPSNLEALTRLWNGWSGFSENEFVDLFVPEILDVVQTAEEAIMVYYRRPGEAQLYVAEMMPHEDGWAVTANSLVLSRPDGARDLTAEEIDRVSAAFKPDIYDEERGEGIANPLACIVNDYYDDVTKLDRSELLAYFPGSTDGTEKEFKLLQAKYPDFFEGWSWDTMPIPIHSYDPKTMNAVLGRYADIRWEDLAWDDDLHYLEETGCFYNYTSDFGLMGFHCTGGWVYDGGAVLVSGSSALYLTERGGDYYIQAHLPAMVFQTGSQPMIPAYVSDEDAVKTVVEAFLDAYEENVYLYTDNEYDHLTVLAADEDAAAFYGSGQPVPMLDFRDNIQDVHKKENYWKQSRQEQGIFRHNYESACYISSITFDGDTATVMAEYAVSFTYDDHPGTTSGGRDPFELLLVQVDGTWLIADVTEFGG